MLELLVSQELRWLRRRLSRCCLRPPLGRVSGLLYGVVSVVAIMQMKGWALGTSDVGFHFTAAAMAFSTIGQQLQLVQFTSCWDCFWSLFFWWWWLLRWFIFCELE